MGLPTEETPMLKIFDAALLIAASTMTLWVFNLMLGA